MLSHYTLILRHFFCSLFFVAPGYAFWKSLSFSFSSLAESETDVEEYASFRTKQFSHPSFWWWTMRSPRVVLNLKKITVSFGLGRWLKHSSPKNLVEFLTCLTLVCCTCQWPWYNSFWDMALPCFLCFLIAISLSLNCKCVYFELTRLCWENHTSSLFPEPFWPIEKIFWVPLSKSTSKINTLETVWNANDQAPPLTCWQKQKLWFYI